MAQDRELARQLEDGQQEGFKMPIQIIPAARTFGSEFGRSLGGGLGQGLSQGISEGFKKKDEQEKESKQNKAASAFYEELTGQKLPQDLPPEVRKGLFTEALKLQGKQQLQENELRAIDEIFGGGQKKGNAKQLAEIGLEAQGLPSNAAEMLRQGQAPAEDSEGFNPLKTTPEQILKTTAVKPALGRAVQGLSESAKRKEEAKIKGEQTAFQSDREYHTKVSQPIIDEASNILKQAPIKKGLINQQRRDIASGNTEGIIPYLVDKTGLEAYRNPESARFKTASKQRFIETIHELGGSNARANQFIEKQLVDAQPTLGRSAESNQTVLDLEEFVEDMKQHRAELELKLAEEDREKHGYARNDIGIRADKMMGDYAAKRQDEMAYDIRKRYEDGKKDEDLVKEIVGKRVTPDTPLTLRSARILMLKNNDDEKAAQAEAKKLGFKIPLESTYKR